MRQVATTRTRKVEPFSPKDGLWIHNYSGEIIDSRTDLTEFQLLYEDEARTRRKAYHYICSANEECSTDVLVYARNSNDADDIVRGRGWSVLKDLGWTCRPCSRLYSNGPIGRRKRKPITVLDRLLVGEIRGNDLAEQR